MKLSDYVFQFLAKRGVKHVFMLPGGGCMHLVDSLGKTEGIEYVSCLHEQAASFAAEAYGEYTNQMGAALVTTGPGGTNCATGIAACWLESAGAMFIAGQAKTQDMILHRGVRSMGQQEVDVTSMMKPITKYAVTVLNPQSIRYHLEKGAYLATHGRKGPVWIEIPLDVQATDIDPNSLIGFDEAAEEYREGETLTEKIQRTIDLFKTSKRPVLLMGNGVRSAGAISEFKELVNQLQIPTLLTWKAMDLLPENHPYYCGRPGGIGQRFANFTQQNADLILVVGARLDLPSVAFDHKNFGKSARKVLVDNDPTEIWKFETKIDIPIYSDAKRFLKELLNQTHQLKGKNWSAWLEKTKQWQKKYPVVVPEYREVKDFVSTYVLMDTLSDLLTAQDLIVPGSSGACADVMMQAFKVKEGQRIQNAPGLGAMGTGLPATIGACLASGKRRTVCVNGEGGFVMNIQELEGVRRMNLPIKYFILNNNGYGSIYNSQEAHFKRKVGADPSSNMTLPEIMKLATAFGLPTGRISNQGQLREELSKILAAPGPSITEIMVDPKEKTLPRVTASVKDGKIVSNPMEDMSPPLDRSEFNEIMKVSEEDRF